VAHFSRPRKEPAPMGRAVEPTCERRKQSFSGETGCGRRKHPLSSRLP
jgi:hypothetical protein